MAAAATVQAHFFAHANHFGDFGLGASGLAVGGAGASAGGGWFGGGGGGWQHGDGVVVALLELGVSGHDWK
jgi:hypothetical protein